MENVASMSLRGRPESTSHRGVAVNDAFQIVPLAQWPCLRLFKYYDFSNKWQNREATSLAMVNGQLFNANIGLINPPPHQVGRGVPSG